MDYFLAGVVCTEDGTPVPNAFVALGDLDSSDDTTLSGADGRFGIDQTPFYSAVHAAALRDGAVWRGEEPADGGPWFLKVVLEPPNPLDPTVLVRVRGHDGRSIPRARAEAVSSSPRVRWRVEDENFVNAAGGWFAVPAHRWRDGATPAFVVSDARDEKGRPLPYGSALVEVDPFGPAMIDVVLPAGTTLTGRVELPDGGPASKIEVELDPPPPAGLDAELRSHLHPLTTTTDADGSFAFGGLSPGKGVLRVAAQERVHAGSGSVRVDAGRRDVVLRLRRVASLHVAVRDESGHALVRAAVRFTVPDDGVRRETSTSDDGVCDLTNLPAGATGTLEIDAGGFIGYRGVEEARPGERLVNLRREATITGHVLGPDGAPLVGMPIRVDPPGEARVHWWWSNDTFEVFELPVGASVTLSLFDGERVVAATRADAGGPPVTLRWPVEGDRLTLLLPERDEPSPLTVSVRSGGRTVASVTPAGRIASFASADVPADAALQVGPDSKERFAFVPHVARRGFMCINWSSGASLAGRITLPGGAGASFARCVATTADGFSFAFEADAEGAFEVETLPAGRVDLTVTARGGFAGAAAVDAPDKGVGIELAKR